MSAAIRRLIVLLVVLGLFCWVFSGVIFQDRNFIYRDAGHFYYPLLKLVQEEWKAGRWPLWNPYENAGMPLLANPASAVLYPPRIVLFQWLPISYGAAYKWYILLHVLLAAATAYAMARHWKASDWAAGVAALCYGFGAVVMFQYCNVIFLVGAAWVPLGLMATDRALAEGDARWSVLLGIVLTMQTLGGDPEAAYLTGGVAALYVALQDWPWAVSVAAALVVAGLGTKYAEAVQPHMNIVFVAPWLGVLLALVLITCFGQVLRMLVVPRLIRVWRTSVVWRLRLRRTGALSLAAGVAVGLSAVQWIPSWEFGRLSVRAAPEANVERYVFWIGPWRFLEMLWPTIAGRQLPQNSRWIDVFKLDDRLWEPSLYVGALPLVLGIAVWGVRQCPHWQRWMSVTLVLSLWAATGPAGGVSWYLHDAPFLQPKDVGAGAVALAEPAAKNQVPPGQTKAAPKLEAPAGGLYWLLVETLPAFGTFRFPAKFMTFAAAALAALAAVGWDRLLLQNDPRAIRLVAVTAMTSFAALLGVTILQGFLLQRFRQSPLVLAGPYYGPLQVAEGVRCILTALAQTSAGLGAVLSTVWWSRRGGRTELGAVMAFAIVAIDLGFANRWMIATAPQSALDAVPRLVQILRGADAPGDEDGVPLRIHRTSIWWPQRWAPRASPVREQEVFLWEHDTIQPKYGVPHGISYTINEGTLEPYDYWWFFAPFYSNTTPEPNSVVYYPRRGYDMWGAKYFVLPHRRVDNEEHRGFLSFLPRTELVNESRFEDDDYQVRRNLDCYPRAWIVHKAIHVPPIHGLNKRDRLAIMRQITYPGYVESGGLWKESELEGRVQDPHKVAWIEHADPALVAGIQAPAADTAADRCRVVRYEPNRMELEVESAARGVLVVAEVFFPGWKLTVDGRRAEILRANRMMRGVALGPGRHQVVFLYDPLSFRLGGSISLGSTGALVLFGLLAWFRRRPRQK